MLSNIGNKGIAYALNRACERAIFEGYSYILTMDQDSYYKAKDLKKLINQIVQENGKERIAIFAPVSKEKKAGLQSEVITSGSIISLVIWKEVGGFREEYFIYVVDYEFCWKVRKAGYRIEGKQVCFYHQLDDYTYQNGKSSYCRDSSKYAYYYGIRNNLYLIKEYFSVVPCESLKRVIKTFRLWGRLWLKEKQKK